MALALLLLTQAYAGDFRDDPRLKPVLASLEEWKRDAVKAAAEALKVDPPATVEFVVKDAAPAEAKSFRVFPDAQFQTGFSNPAVIILHAEFLVNGQFDVREELRHESVHAVMRSVLRRKHDDVPVWVREGLAVFLAGQGDSRLDLYLSDAAYADAPEALVRPLKEKHDQADYVRDVLFIEYLRREKRLDAFIGAVMSGAALEKALGEPLDAFEGKAAEFARAEIKRRLGPDHDAFCGLLRINREKRWVDLAPAAREFLEKHGKTRYAGTAGYLAAKGLYMGKRHDEALAAFESWLQTPGGRRSTWADDALYRIGRIHAQKRNWPEAARAFERCVREFPGNGALAQAAYEWGFALEAGGEHDRAVGVLRKALEGFPEHASAARAREIVK